MGLLKLAKTAIDSVKGSFSDQYLEYVTCPDFDPTSNIIVQRGIVNHGNATKGYNDGVISNGSLIVVPVGCAMVFVDNGEIKEFSAEPGEYTWDKGTESSVFTGNLGENLLNTFKIGLKRTTFAGQAAKDQRVYYVNLKMFTQTFGSKQPELVVDPVYGSVKITYNGEFQVQFDDPMLLINNYVGSNPVDTLTFDDIFSSGGEESTNILRNAFGQKISEAIASTMIDDNLSFNVIQTKKSKITEKINELLAEKFHQNYGVSVKDVTLRVSASEDSLEQIAEIDKVRGMANAEAARVKVMSDAYGQNIQASMAAASGEALMNAAKNESGAMNGFVGMGFAQNGATNIGTMIGNLPGAQSTVQQPTTPAANAKICAKCGSEVTGNFCTNCGTKYEEPKSTKTCPNCGKEVAGKFCGDCGTAVE